MRKIICLFASAIAAFTSAFAGRIVDEAFMSNYVNRVVAEKVTKLVNSADDNSHNWTVAENGKLEKEFVIIGEDGLLERKKVQYDVSCEETRIEKLGCVVKSSTHPSFKAGDLLACVNSLGETFFVGKSNIISPEDGDDGYELLLFGVDYDYDELVGEWRTYYELTSSWVDCDSYYKRSTDEIEVTYYDDGNRVLGVVVFAPRRLSDSEYRAIVPVDDNEFVSAEENDWAEIAHPQTVNFTLTFKEVNPALNNGTGSVSAPRIALTANRKIGGANKSAASVLNIPLGADDDPPPDDDLPPDDPEDPPPPDDPLPDDPIPDDPTPPDEPPPDDPPPPEPPKGTTKVNVSVNTVCNAPMVYLDDDTACDNEDHEGCYWKPNPNWSEADWNNPNSWITLPIPFTIEYHDSNGKLVGTYRDTIDSWTELVRILEGQNLPIPTIPPYPYAASVVVHNNADYCRKGKHNWVNCTCKRCGAIRQHDFVCKDDNCATCVNMNTDLRGNATTFCGIQCPYTDEQYHRGWHHESFDEKETFCCSCQCGRFGTASTLLAHSYERTNEEPTWFDKDFHVYKEKCSRCMHIRNTKEQHIFDSRNSESRPIVNDDGTMNPTYHLTSGFCTVCDKNHEHGGNDMFVKHTIRIVGNFCQCVYCFNKEGYDSESLHDIDDEYHDDCYNYGCSHTDVETGALCQRAILNLVTGAEPQDGLRMHFPCQEDDGDDQRHLCLCHAVKYDHQYDYEYDGYKFCAGENSQEYDLDYGVMFGGYANKYCGHRVYKGGQSGKGKCKWNPEHDDPRDFNGNRNRIDPRKLAGNVYYPPSDNPEPEPLPTLPDPQPVPEPDKPVDPNNPSHRDKPEWCDICHYSGKETRVIERNQEFKVLASRPSAGVFGIPLSVLPMIQLVGVEHNDVLETWGERSTKPYRWNHKYYTDVELRQWPDFFKTGLPVDENEQWVKDWINGK